MRISFNLTLLFFIVLLSSSSLLAQQSFTVSDKDAAGLLKSGTLAVVIKAEEEGVMKKLSKNPDELKAYQESLSSFNNYIRQVVEKEWSISKEVVFISEVEAEQIKASKKVDYFLLEITEVKNYKMGDFYMVGRGAKNAGNMADLNKEWDFIYHIRPSGGAIALAIIQASKPDKELALSFLPTVGISKGSVTYMVLNLKNQILDCEKGITSWSKFKDDIEVRESKLKTKTLLIFDPLVSNGLQKMIDKDELDEDYSFPYEIVSFEQADEVITDKNSKYAFIWVIPAGLIDGQKVLFNYFIIDAEDGRPLFLTGQAAIGANGEFHQTHLIMANKKVKK